MIYDWYNLFSLPEFLDTGLVSRTIDVVLDGVGEKEILVTRGNEVGVQYDDVFMMVNFGGRNPISVQGDLFTYALYKDADENIWLGIGIEE